MILLITGYFKKYDDYGYYTGEKEFAVSHGIDMSTGNTISLPTGHPLELGAVFDDECGEWVIK